MPMRVRVSPFSNLMTKVQDLASLHARLHLMHHFNISVQMLTELCQACFCIYICISS
jgi:hypothetical protein